jgi:hypothetical protein
MLNNTQLAKLEELEYLIMQIIASQEYQSLIESDYHPDVNLADARQGIGEVLDYHLASESVAISPNLQKLFSDRALSNKLMNIDFNRLESFNNY